MNTIKFRAWSKADKKFRPLILPKDGDAIFLQYTELKDHNGVEVYEGDIVEINNIRAYIKWGDWAELGWFYVPISDVDYARPLMKGHKTKVVGNIYENPDYAKK